jgi:cytochrome c peroxidase
MGKFKTPTIRNVAVGANRRYMHNGILNSLEAVVHFYNTRDVPGEGWIINGTFQTWQSLGKEVNQNLEIHGAGNLGLTAQEEADLVAFMKTLSDGWRTTTAPPTTVL